VGILEGVPVFAGRLGYAGLEDDMITAITMGFAVKMTGVVVGSIAGLMAAIWYGLHDLDV